MENEGQIGWSGLTETKRITGSPVSTQILYAKDKNGEHGISI